MKRWIISLFERTVAELRRELAAAEKSRDELARTLDGVNRTCREIMAERDCAERLLNAVADGIDFSPDSPGWRETPSTALHAVGAHLDRLRAADIGRAERTETELADCRRELADVRHELDVTAKGLTVAEEENKRLWLLCELHDARIESSLAREHHRASQARAAAQLVDETGDIGE